MLFKFEIIVEPCEIRELVFGSPLDAMMTDLKAKFPKPPEINESGVVQDGHHRIMAAAGPGDTPAPPPVVPTPPVPFDSVAAAKTLTDLRATMLKQRETVKTDTDTLTKNTNDFNKEIKTIGTGLAMKVGDEKYLTTTIDGAVYIIKLTQPQLGNFGCQFIKQG